MQDYQIKVSIGQSLKKSPTKSNDTPQSSGRLNRQGTNRKISESPITNGLQFP